MRFLSIFFLLASPALGETCPAVPEQSAEYADLYAALQDAASPAEAQSLSGDLWLLWLKAPDDHAQSILDRGLRQLRDKDLLDARDTLDGLVAYCPDYAEGYNQRAFANFLRRDFEAALTDLDVALALNPRHLGALSGKALTLMGLGREEDAQAVLRAALALNPWLPERSLVKGTDI